MHHKTYEDVILASRATAAKFTKLMQVGDTVCMRKSSECSQEVYVSLTTDSKLAKEWCIHRVENQADRDHKKACELVKSFSNTENYKAVLTAVTEAMNYIRENQ